MPPICYPLLLKYKYRKALGKKCNLKNPIAYTEKVQWAKLHRKDPLLTMLSDKIEVRKWVEDKIGKEYLIPTIGGVYSSPAEIDFDSLPERFVIKSNTGSGNNIVVNSKDEIDIKDLKEKIDKWSDYEFAYSSLELQYKGIIPKIYIEKNILEDGMDDLPDYKFFCFGGKVFCSYTMRNYVFDHKKGELGFFDKDYKHMPYYRADYAPIKTQIAKPKNYDKMVEIAEQLSRGLSHVRVDLYNVDGKIYFGEMTFSTNSGYIKFLPEEFDIILGNQWDLKSGI